MSSFFKFRCYRCEKLLKAPASRAGKVVPCPGCGAELIVPGPDDEADPRESPDDPPIRLEELGLRLEPERLVQAPRPASSPPIIDASAPDPIAFLESEAAFEEEFRPDPDAEEPPLEGLPETPDPAASPLVPGPRSRGRAALIDPASRRRDVVLPRTAAVAWSLFALLALAFAFLAGLMVGHYRWK